MVTKFYKGEACKNCVPGRWKKSELKFLEENYYKLSPEELASKLGRTWESIQAKARKIGLYRDASKVAEYYPDTSKLVREFWEEKLQLLEKSLTRLDKWTDQLEKQRVETGMMSNRDLIALAKAVDSIRAVVTDVAKYLGIIESKSETTKIENLTINMNVMSMIQIANEIMTPEQRNEFLDRLKAQGIVEEVMKP